MKRSIVLLILLLMLSLFCPPLTAQRSKTKKPPDENDYYRMISFPLPDDVVLEVGGLDWLDKGKKRLLVCTRHGEVWELDNVYVDAPAVAGKPVKGKGKDGKLHDSEPDPTQVVHYRRLLSGLHEPLGLLVRDDGIYMAQRGELTRVRINKKGKIDTVEAFCDEWETSGGYHEFAFGPKEDRDGNLWVTLNRPFGNGQEGTAYWRGWAVKIDRKGKMHPVCPGLRSPCGLGTNADGAMFYTDNQGDWTAACKLSHLKPGLFQGEAVGLLSCDHPLSTMKHPGKGYPISGLLWPDAVQKMKWLVPPAVWFPYPQMGRSHSDVLCDITGGKFGPFAGQVFVGDQANAIVVRVFLEKVDGEYQGACFPFRKGFGSGVLRMCWGRDGSMFAGGTNRGWGGGSKPYALDRLVWTGKVPFEPHEMRATPTGFRVTFTRPVDRDTARDVKSYAMKCWTYKYHSGYGDPPRNLRDLTVEKVRVSEDGRAVDLEVKGLAAYHVHELRLDGVRDRDGEPLLHPIGYYTLNRIPGKEARTKR
ncbi:MAG TPA: hypothetical protein VMG10_17200 [Gemmataceae bacterium]|nr:hypothetical protein [Gemmataceae bacterium]